MPRLSHYLRRALQAPPRETLRAARVLAATGVSSLRQRLELAHGPDPLASDTFARHLGLADRLAADGCAERLFRHGDAVLPVCPHALDALDELDVRSVHATAQRGLEHTFDLLGSGPVRVACRAEEADRIRARMEQLLPGSAGGYHPIDWHTDFKSGFCWPPGQWFWGISFGDVPGVDVKVPWELSRFQHVGPLGLAWLIDPHGPIGRQAPLAFRSQVVDWIAANPVARGVNWRCAMDVALRATGWLTGIALMNDAAELDGRFRWLVACSLLWHGRHIERNLEYYPTRTGNHYLSDIVGLLCIGAALPELPESARWCTFALQELESEIRRQVLPDGADIEGSIAYHHLVAELFLLAALVAVRLPAQRRGQLAAAVPGSIRNHLAPALRPLADQVFDLHRPELFSSRFWESLHAMAEYSLLTTRPDGRICQTGDNDSGRCWILVPPAPSREKPEAADHCDRRTLLAAAGRLFGNDDMMRPSRRYAADARLLVADAPVASIRAAAPARNSSHPHRVHAAAAAASVTVMPHGGVAVMRTPRLFLLTTFGTIPEVNGGGHFHNDLLSFELMIVGVPFVADGGAWLYTPDPVGRDRFRGTAAHSTIHVHGVEQRTWPDGAGRLFAVAVDASTAVLRSDGDSLTLAASYRSVRHERTFRVSDTGVSVTDVLHAGGPADWRLNLHPQVAVGEPVGRDRAEYVIRLRSGACAADLTIRGVHEPVIEPGCFSAGYGIRVENRAVCARLAGPVVTAEFVIINAMEQAS